MRTQLGAIVVVTLWAACGGGGEQIDPGPDASAREDTAGTDGASTPLRVFVTGAFAGTMYEPGGGLAAGDAKCAYAASGAAIGGVWRAWLSTASMNAIDRIAGGGPWRLMDGTTVFAGRAELAIGPA